MVLFYGEDEIIKSNEVKLLEKDIKMGHRSQWFFSFLCSSNEKKDMVYFIFFIR